MIVKLVRPWNNWDAGQVFVTLSDGIASLLISRGVGVEIVPAKQDALPAKQAEPIALEAGRK
jgi:hypothetical protein